jgi:hypothetical protein
VVHNGALGAPRRYEHPALVGVGQGIKVETKDATNSNIFQTKS